MSNLQSSINGISRKLSSVDVESHYKLYPLYLVDCSDFRQGKQQGQ